MSSSHHLTPHRPHRRKPVVSLLGSRPSDRLFARPWHEHAQGNNNARDPRPTFSKSSRSGSISFRNYWQPSMTSVKTASPTVMRPAAKRS